MQCQSLQESIEGMCTARCEVLSEAVASNVGHVVFVGQGWNGALGIFALECFVEEDEIGEATAHVGMRRLERFEIGLRSNFSAGFNSA